MNRFYFVPLLGAKLEKCETRTPMIPMPAQFFGKGSKNLAKGTASQQHLSSVSSTKCLETDIEARSKN